MHETALLWGIGKKGISPYLKQSPGPSLVTVPTSGYTLSALPWGPMPASTVSFHSPQVLHCSSQRQTHEDLSLCSETISWAIGLEESITAVWALMCIRMRCPTYLALAKAIS